MIDATGRQSRGSALAPVQSGAKPPYQEQADSGFIYYTRYFSGTEPTRMAPGLTPLGTISVLTLPGDNGTWSVTLLHRWSSWGGTGVLQRLGVARTGAAHRRKEDQPPVNTGLYLIPLLEPLNAIRWSGQARVHTVLRFSFFFFPPPPPPPPFFFFF